ncbi:hypothetical protein ABPG77_001354 [Micractinium sp. CCAP 211/92]
MTLSYYSPARPARGAGRAGAPSSGGNTLSHRPDCPPGTTLFTPASMPPPPINTGSHGTKSACLAFFSAGSSAAAQGFVSENGLAEAARFHETTRPLEGRMKIPRSSRVAPRGARFAN